MSIIYLSAVGAVVVIIIVLTLSMKDAEAEIESTGEDQTQVKTDIKDLSITIPENAFPYPKKFRIEEIPRNAAYDNFKQLGNFYGDIYELTPVDGRTDLALEPMTYDYLIPGEFYFGKEFNNAELIYIEDKENPVVRVFSGGEIYENSNSQPVLRAKGFHGSLIGLRISNPVKPELGLKEIIEKEDTLKPDLMLIPGIDSNFKGFLPNTISNSNPQGNNLWEVTFPDRSIWVYQYPLTETRTMDYVTEAKTFFNTISMKSYVRFEADKLAQKLLSSNKTFDIIAHGIGGIIARYAVENYPITNVRKMVLVSVPNSGSNIVNPSFLNLIYGKDPEILSKIYGLTSDTIRYLERNNLSYLEKVNTFYTDILPYSETINTLQTSIREDIEYFFVAGSKPDFNADLQDSQFAKFYPENTLEKGDGIVSVYSAIAPAVDEATNNMENITFKTFPFSFFDIFMQQQTLQYIFAFLEQGIEVVEVPEFKDDTFKEWLFDTGSTLTANEDIRLPDTDQNSTESSVDLNSTDTTGSATEQISDKSATDSVDSDLERWRNQFFNNNNQTVTSTTTESETSESNTASDNNNTSNHQDTDNTISVNSSGTTSPASESAITDNSRIDTIVSILNDINNTTNSTDTISKNNHTGDLKTYQPDSSMWNGTEIPQKFSNINNMIVYNYNQFKVPDDIEPYGMTSVNGSLYLFDNKGIVYFNNGIFNRINDNQSFAYTTYSGSLFSVHDNILTQYINGEPVKMEYLMFDAPVLSIGINDSVQYYLLHYNGLTLETPFSSFKLDGHYGEIIMHGMYPYIITDEAVYLFNGKECHEIYRPYSNDINLLTGIIAQDSLYVIASDYSLRVISLDGKKELLLTSNNTGGIKVLKNPQQVIVVGKNKFNIIDYQYKQPKGTYFDIPDDEKIKDAVMSNGNMMVLSKKDAHYFLKKVAILE
jgi:pimeloyl-ACP methyl ester carboxylesterase